MDGERAKPLRVDQLSCLHVPDGFEDVYGDEDCDEHSLPFHLEERFPTYIQQPYQSQPGDPGYFCDDDIFSDIVSEEYKQWFMDGAPPGAYDRLLKEGKVPGFGLDSKGNCCLRGLDTLDKIINPLKLKTQKGRTRKKRAPSIVDNITPVDFAKQAAETDFGDQKSIKKNFKFVKGKGKRDVPLKQLMKLETQEAKAKFTRDWRGLTDAQQLEAKETYTKQMKEQKDREKEAKQRGIQVKKRARIAKKTEDDAAKAVAKQLRQADAPRKKREKDIRRNDSRNLKRSMEAKENKEVSTLYSFISYLDALLNC